MRQDDQRLIRLLAATLTRRPRSNLTELAAGAGISRATLYRFAPTRAAIVEKVTAEAWMRLQAALPGGDASPDPMARLRRMTHALVEDLDLVIYIVNEMGMEGAERGNTYYAAPEWESFQAHLDAFFLHGQQRGVFGIEMPASWWSDFYLSCLFGAGWAVATGRLAQASVVRAVLTSFLEGARSGSRMQPSLP
ncbi:TetR/AcrR family transcriptional regulator [Xanthomonas oryzae]|uniref:TetR/AcrR family transcriptional regulator n=1 Tax=Xanthomonas oryzae TaxID=347 RepID=UPI00040E50CC|nr:TetR/AcrR family transcriptional regulator [Xanthomonas oryzae]AVT99239.1 TetR/AcrR family transcriptional regulator [Xanthomonas oryzae pv. oryzae]QBN28529.1 TetR/AcrR family transcriptional regulator [Xanthomonas oryzae pv. oryzae]QBN32393.1 TetR/AcrR family transcriptional regulator [Xanthomonas oryzae pv. oryzae]QBN61273.1 TetR/AcrR family transcriptional regulator [Xanthomonas oryzae pv. oryzae]QBN64912.1 TetR/AcrR family transcriptional regulator [Xanthomonas oryzae pv. oryzae]